jgi:DNA replication protein DnaC
MQTESRYETRLRSLSSCSSLVSRLPKVSFIADIISATVMINKMIALSRARQYVEEFDGNIASFIFSGKPGTGKNHLAA